MNQTEQLLKQLIHLLNEETPSQGINHENSHRIPVGVSNRHIHLSEADVEQLFGKGYQLTKLKALKQPGQYAAKETVTIAGPKGSICNVRVLGPTRAASQIEISKSDSFSLGIKAPIRESGDVADSGTLTAIGPKGAVVMESQVIIAKRHLHMTPADAAYHGVKNKELISIRIPGERTAILGDVVVRVDEQFQLECHLDLDEANAVSVGSQSFVEIYRSTS